MRFNYCLQCAAPLTRKDNTDFVCANGHEYWNNPLGTASVLMVRDDNVLLVKRAIEPRKGMFNFVGGFINYGEEPYAAARREVTEETTLTVGNLTLLEVFGSQYTEGTYTTNVFFVATDWTGEPTAQDDAAELAWKPIDFLAETSNFAWPMPSLVAKLHGFLDNTSHD